MSKFSSLPVQPAGGLSTPHLYDIESLNSTDLDYLLRLTLYYAAIRSGRFTLKSSPLTGATQINLFLENSTRTNLSFELAGKRLGAHTLVVPVAASSLQKGESLEDTALTLAAFGADLMVLRNSAEDSIERVAKAFDAAQIECRLINAGTGTRAHPSQALLDATTLLLELGRTVDEGLNGLTIAICGDIRHSRVAGSNAHLMTRLGATVRFVAPKHFQPADAYLSGIDRSFDLREGIDGCDIVMALRVQAERVAKSDPTSLNHDTQDFINDFALTHQSIKWAKPDVKIMHPGPMNRGVEIDTALADDPAHSLVLKQVANGVVARMGILHAFYETKTV